MTFWDRSTVWARFLKHLGESKIAPDKVDTYVEVTRLLLSAGATDDIHDEEGKVIEIPRHEKIIRAAFPKRDAEDLIASFEVRGGYLQAQRLKFTSWFQSTMS